MPQLGRITGPLLEANLLRNGVDLAFETTLLYIDVNDDSIGINKNPSSVYDLDANSEIHTTDIIVDTAANVANIIINSSSTFTTSTGPINLSPSSAGAVIFHDRMSTSNLVFDGNSIFSSANANIVIDPNGSGTTQIYADTNVTGNVNVSGNITTSQNIILGGNLIIGDSIVDTITVSPDFTQSIIPGQDLVWSLGEDTGDSSPRRWNQLYFTDETKVNFWYPDIVDISNQTRINGLTNTISALQSNDDIEILPDTGIVYIERTKWQNSDITNLNNTAITLGSTGIGYNNFNCDNAMVIPAGNDSERRASPDVGETRWNTDQDYLECFDGSVWSPSIGAGGAGLTVSGMEDLGHIYTIILG